MIWDLDIWDFGYLRVCTSVGTILAYWRDFLGNFQVYAEKLLLRLVSCHASEIKLPQVALSRQKSPLIVTLIISSNVIGA